MYAVFVLFVSLHLVSYVATTVTDETQILFTSTNGINILDTVTGKISSIAINLADLISYRGVAFNSRTSTLYLTEIGVKKQADHRHIIVANLSNFNTGVVDVKRIPSHSLPLSVASDDISNNFYFADTVEGEVVVVKFDTRRNFLMRILMADLPAVRSIVTDPIKGVLFVSLSLNNRYSTGEIISAHMDGTNRKTIIDTDIKWPQYLAIDRAGLWLYWTDTIKATIEKCRYDGSERQTIITYYGIDTIQLLSLTLDKTYIYFSATDIEKVQRVPLAGGAIEEIGVTSDDLTFPIIYDMVAVSTALEVTGSNGCSFANGGCAQFCLPTPTGHRCACDEKFTLDPSGKDCLLASFQKVVIVVDNDRSGIFLVDVPTGAYVRADIFNINDPTSITWDPIAGTLMWASRFYKRIRRSCIHPQSCVDLIALWPDHTLRLEGLAIDPFKKHLYLTDAVNFNIFRVSYEGNVDAKNRTKTLIVKLGMSTPRGLAVDLTYRMLYWTEYHPIPRIRKASMDGGSKIITVIDNDIKWPNDVVIDTERQLIYWCDGLKKTIETATTNGDKRTVLYTGKDVILSLTLAEHHIIFSDSKTGSLHQIDRWNGVNAYAFAFGPNFFSQPYDIIYVDKSSLVTIPPTPPTSTLSNTPTTTLTPTTTPPTTTMQSTPTNGTNKVDLCSGVTCHKRGVCISGSTNYRCMCFDGWSGDLCTIEAHPCTPDSCDNAGVCIPQYGTHYICQCLAGYTGPRCTLAPDPCSSAPCLNDGKCQGLGNATGAFRCWCPIEYSGKLCQYGSCSDKACYNGGTCRRLKNSKVICNCRPGYKGDFCGIRSNPCLNNPCKNGGRCKPGQEDKDNFHDIRGEIILDLPDEYQCECEFGFKGPRCGDGKLLMILVVLLCGVFLLLLVIICCKCCHQYSHLGDEEEPVVANLPTCQTPTTCMPTRIGSAFYKSQWMNSNQDFTYM